MILFEIIAYSKKKLSFSLHANGIKSLIRMHCSFNIKKKVNLSFSYLDILAIVIALMFLWNKYTSISLCSNTMAIGEFTRVKLEVCVVTQWELKSLNSSSAFCRFERVIWNYVNVSEICNVGGTQVAIMWRFESRSFVTYSARRID